MTGALITKGIKLTSGTDYGTDLPNSPATNQLFFQTVGTNFVLDTVYPVGSIYMSVNSTNPGTLFGGTWEQIQGKFLLGMSSSYPAGSSGGEASHTLTADELPDHEHWVRQRNNSTRAYTRNFYMEGSSSTDPYSSVIRAEMSGGYGKPTVSWGGQLVAGGITSSNHDQPHNNMPPYLSVYIWKRTA